MRPYLPVAVVGGAVTVMVLTGSFVLAVIYLVVDAAPVAMLTRMVWTTAPAGTKAGPDTTTPDAAPNTAMADAQDGPAIGRTLALMTIGASGAIAAVLTLLAMMPKDDATKGGGIEATLRAQIDEIIAAVPVPAVDPAKGEGGVDLAAARAQVVRSLAGLIPGAAAWNWSLRALLSAALGQLMLKRMGLALWTTPAYRRFAVPSWFFLLLGGVAGAALVLKGDPGFIAGNTAVALCLPPVLQGLAVVHCGRGAAKASRHGAGGVLRGGAFRSRRHRSGGAGRRRA